VRPAEELRYLILGAQREGNRAYAAALRPSGLTPSQAEAVLVLKRSPGLSLSALGARLVCESGSPSRLVDSLVRAGLVHRDADPRSRRSVVLRLTAGGARAAVAAKAAESALNAAIESELHADAIDATVTVLRGFLAQRPAGDAIALRKADDAGQ
jgi:DNA-binding MarR family transcriptional regulator